MKKKQNLWNRFIRWFAHRDEWDKFREDSSNLYTEMIKDYEVAIDRILAAKSGKN